MASVTALPPSRAHYVTIPAGQQHLSGLPSPELKTHPDSSAPNPNGSVDADLCFYQPPKDGAKPFNYVEQPPEGTPQKNFGEEWHVRSMHDVRGEESKYTLDKNAVGLVRGVNSSPKINWRDDETIKEHYYPEVEQVILQNVPGAKSVYLFDHTIRLSDPNAARGPVVRCHIDQTPWSAANRVKRHATSPEEGEKQLQERYRIINVWRPLNGKVFTNPLAFCDSATFTNEDIVPIEHKYPTWSGETASVAFSEGQKWMYWSQMDNDERILLQCFDSDKPMNRLPHTAFKDPRSQDDWKQRESIEVRALVYG